MQKPLPGFICAMLLCAALAPPAHCQPEPAKYGKVEPAQLQMKTYDKDTSAAAVVLCDYGQAAFQYNNAKGFQVRFERLVRIKILKKSGYDWATGEIPLYHDGLNKEEVTDLKGTTYNWANGQMTKDKLDKDAVFTEKQSANLWVQKFTLPNVREGSVVEYSYTTASDFPYNFQEWNFQSVIPVVWSEFRAVIPEYFNYKLQAGGYEPYHIATTESGNTIFSIRTEGGFTDGSNWGSSGREAARYDPVTARTTNHRWVMKDVPAIRPEAYITTPKDYLSRLEFELASTNFPGQGMREYSNGWKTLNQTLLKSDEFGVQLTRTGFLKDHAAKIKASHADPARRALAAYAFVRSHMKWNGQRRVFSDQGIKKAFDTRSGSTADINLMLVALLRDLDVQARPVLLSTRDHGRVMPYSSMLSGFNYVVACAMLDGQPMFLDATDTYLAPGMLPLQCLNSMGRLIDDAGGDWIDLTAKQKASELVSVQMIVGEDGGLTGRLEKSRSGYDAWLQRGKIMDKGKDKLAEWMKKECPNWQIAKAELTNLDNVENALGEKYELSISEACQKAGNTLYLKPMLGEGFLENPFKLTERKYPVDFATAIEKTFIALLTIPAGYKVEELPKSSSVALPENAGRFIFQVAVNGNTIQVSSKVSLRKPVYYAEEYAALREFYSQIVGKHAEQIVLKKI